MKKHRFRTKPEEVLFPVYSNHMLTDLYSSSSKFSTGGLN